MKITDVALLREWFERLFAIGKDSEGGVTRMGYTAVEDNMHAAFGTFAAELGLHVESDEFGNTFVSFPGVPREGVRLIGSHLDSVPHGGVYDGVTGVLAGLLVMKMCLDEGIAPPIETVAFRCEESSAFDYACVGSSLMLGLLDENKTKKLTRDDGVALYYVLKTRNPDIELPQRPNGGAARFRDYLEIHIEQGRILEEYGKPIGIVTAIAAPYRFRVFLTGQQDHSGGTPMAMRRDALCGACEIVLAVEETAKSFKETPLVGTVGVIHNTPNALNTVPGKVEIRVDVRGIDDAAILHAVEKIQSKVRLVARGRKLDYKIETIATYPPVDMDKTLQKELAAAANRLEIDSMSMYSGAGHDAMRMAIFVPTGMVFIPCKNGVSHNPNEEADLVDIVRAAQVVFETLRADIA